MKTTDSILPDAKPPRRPFRRVVALGFLAVALILTGCQAAGGNAPPGAAPQGENGLPDPCSLLSVEEITALVGGSFDEGQYNEALSTDAQALCDWPVSGGGYPLVQVLIGNDGADIASHRELTEEAFGTTSTDVSVAGATNAYTAREGAILGMAVGQYFVEVTYDNGPGADVSSTTIALAEVAASNL